MRMQRQLIWVAGIGIAYAVLTVALRPRELYMACWILLTLLVAGVVFIALWNRGADE